MHEKERRRIIIADIEAFTQILDTRPLILIRDMIILPILIAVSSLGRVRNQPIV